MELVVLFPSNLRTMLFLFSICICKYAYGHGNAISKLSAHFNLKCVSNELISG